jgi:hypothetical protein
LGFGGHGHLRLRDHAQPIGIVGGVAPVVLPERQDARMLGFRWLLEARGSTCKRLQARHLSFFAQELRSPQPVRIKRLEKAGCALND